MNEDTFYGPDFELLSKQDPDIAGVVLSELKRQQQSLQLIASENFTSRAVLATLGSTLSNKYAEGYPGKRYYGGCEEVDKAEIIAIDRAKSYATRHLIFHSSTRERSHHAQKPSPRRQRRCLSLGLF